MPPLIPSFTQTLSDLTTLVKLQITLKSMHGSIDTAFTSLIGKITMNLISLSVSPSEGMKSGDLGILHFFTMQRGQFASLEYPLRYLDGLVGQQLKALERPPAPSIADLTPLTMVRNLLTDSEAETYAGKLDEIIQWVTEQVCVDEVTVNEIC